MRLFTNGVSRWQAAAQDGVWGAAIGAHSGPSLKPEAEAWTHTNPLVGASPQASGGFGSGPLEAWAVTASGSAPHTTLPQAANGLIDGPGGVEFGRRVTSAAALSPSKAKAVGAPRPPPPPPRAVSVPGVPGGATGAVGTVGLPVSGQHPAVDLPESPAPAQDTQGVQQRPGVGWRQWRVWRRVQGVVALGPVHRRTRRIIQQCRPGPCVCWPAVL